jgi:hypothetical protein
MERQEDCLEISIIVPMTESIRAIIEKSSGYGG